MVGTDGAARDAARRAQGAFCAAVRAEAARGLMSPRRMAEEAGVPVSALARMLSGEGDLDLLSMARMAAAVGRELGPMALVPSNKR